MSISSQEPTVLAQAMTCSDSSWYVLHALAGTYWPGPPVPVLNWKLGEGMARTVASWLSWGLWVWYMLLEKEVESTSIGAQQVRLKRKLIITFKSFSSESLFLVLRETWEFEFVRLHSSCWAYTYKSIQSGDCEAVWTSRRRNNPLMRSLNSGDGWRLGCDTASPTSYNVDPAWSKYFK